MASRTRKNIGVLGLGIIGQRVVSNLRERGFHVFVWNRTPRPVPNFVGSPAEVAELCDFIQIFVADDDALLAMMQRMTPGSEPCPVVPKSALRGDDLHRPMPELQTATAPQTMSKRCVSWKSPSEASLDR